MAEEKKPAKRGSKSASIKKNNSATKEQISQAIQESFQFFGMEKVKSAEEMAGRLNYFFSLCNETGQIPTVEDMCLCLGSYYGQIWNWEQGMGLGRDSEVREMIKKAKQIIGGVEAKLTMTGTVNPVTYIFRAKNYYGMKDQQDVVVKPANPLGDQTDSATLQQKYLEAADCDFEIRCDSGDSDE